MSKTTFFDFMLTTSSSSLHLKIPAMPSSTIPTDTFFSTALMTEGADTSIQPRQAKYRSWMAKNGHVRIGVLGFFPCFSL